MAFSLCKFEICSISLRRRFIIEVEHEMSLKQAQSYDECLGLGVRVEDEQWARVRHFPRSRSAKNLCAPLGTKNSEDSGQLQRHEHEGKSEVTPPPANIFRI